MNPTPRPPQSQQNKLSVYQRLRHLASRAGLDAFVLALLLVIVLAYLWPEGGIQEKPFSLSELAGFGVSGIFFFYGLRLNPEKLRAGLRNWQLHTVVQLTTFLLFPLLILACRELFVNEQNNLLWLGIFFLAVLPSTVSSSVVMVSIAGGNLPAAIFNASISSLIGVLLTPAWMGILMQAGTTVDMAGQNFWTVIGKLSLQVLAPVLLGILLHRRLGSFAEKYRQQLRYFDQFIILLIVYTSFCESFARRMFQDFRLTDLLLLSAGMIGLFLGIYFVVSMISRSLHFSREDRITAVFCGSKKSLVHGTVMSKVLFAGSPFIGVILLPLMLYHALQLIAASIIAQSLARQHKAVKTESGT
jgi:sodium/bile acid cotransporter 7